MSESVPFGLPITSPQPLSPQGFLGGGNLLQMNTTLLQPISGSFKLFDLMWLMMLTSATAMPAIAALGESTAEMGANALATEINLANEISVLQQQIDALNARLTDAGIA